MRVARLDEQMQVIALDGELRDAEVAALARRSEASADFLHECPAPKRRHVALHSQRDVRRALARHRLAPHVIDDRAPPARATGAASRSAASRAPAMIVEGELQRAHRRIDSRLC
ncbi:MAG TPA: hypothetical protein VFY49_11025 [Myxococcota bacterium]|nr:hypothetical protein [Myxococcota bacterium]